MGRGFSVGIFGPTPPPFGGVSIHVARLVDRLEERDCDYTVYSTSESHATFERSKFLKKGPLSFVSTFGRAREDIFHLHTSNLPAICAATVISKLRRKRIVLTLHNQRLLVSGSRSAALRFLSRFILRRQDHIIAVSREIHTWLASLGVPDDRLSTVPAFLPPSEHEVDERNLPAAAAAFLSTHQPILAAQGWFGYFKDGAHVYSFDLLADLLEGVRRHYPNAGLYTVISGTYDRQHRAAVLDELESRGLQEHWLVLEEPFPAVSLYARTDLFLRPTTTDGDSVSVRECLSLRVPVLASDAVRRPTGCVLFRNRDQQDFLEQTLMMLDDLPGLRAGLPEAAEDEHFPAILDIYQRLTAGE